MSAIPETCAVNPLELVEQILFIASAISDIAKESRDAIIESEGAPTDGSPYVPLHTGRLVVKQMAIDALAEQINGFAYELQEMARSGARASAPTMPRKRGTRAATPTMPPN